MYEVPCSDYRLQYLFTWLMKQCDSDGQWFHVKDAFSSFDWPEDEGGSLSLVAPSLLVHEARSSL